MTMTGTAEGHEAPAKEVYYAVLPEVIEATGRSLNVVLGDRLCEAAVAKLKSPGAWRTMSYRELSKLLRENCADQEGFLSPQQPILETAFRLLLTAGNGRLSLSEVHARVIDLWMTSSWPRHISLDALKRVLDHGVSYGIVPVETGEDEQ